MKQIDDFHDSLQECLEDEADIETYTFSLKPADSKTVIDGIESQSGFALPEGLKTLLTTDGAFHHEAFGMAWNVIRLYSAQEIYDRLSHFGLVSFIDNEWGGRPEINRIFAEEETQKLNDQFLVWGYRYVDDNEHDYYVIDRAGQVMHVLFNQDDWEDVETNLRALLDGTAEQYDFEEFVEEQLELVLEGI